MKQTIKDFWNRHEYVSIALLWGAIVLIVYWNVLTADAGMVIGGNDISNLFVHWLRFIDVNLKQGVLPLWNPYVFSGTPFIANAQSGLFYPFSWFVFLLGPERTIGLNIALHTWLIAFGMYAWLRSIHATRAGAFLGATALALSGFISARTWAGHYTVILSIAWLPILLWTLMRALRRWSIAWAIVAGLPLGLMFLAGHPPTFVMLAFAAFVVVAYDMLQTAREAGSIRPALKMLGLFAITAIVGVALIAAQLLPTLVLLQNSARAADRSLEFASNFSMPFSHLLIWLVPDFFGEPVTTGYWGAPVFEEYIYYIGIPALILIALSIFIRDGRMRWLTAFGFFGLWFALGPDGGLYTIIYRLIPAIDFVRAPARAGMWAMFAFSAVAGLSLSQLQQDATRRVLVKWSWLVIAIVTGVGLIVAAGARVLYERSVSLPEAPRYYHLADDVILFVILFGAASILLRMWLKRIEQQHLWTIGLIALLMIDLAIYHDRLMRVVPSMLSGVYEAAKLALPDQLQLNRFIWVNANLFELNGSMDYQQSNIYGYDPLIVDRFQKLFDRRADLNSSIYDLLNLRYVITQFELSESLTRIADKNGFAFFERSSAAPRAWLVHAIESEPNDEAVLDRIATPGFDAQASAVVVGDTPCSIGRQSGAEAVSITEYDLNWIVTQVDASAAGLLVFSEIDYPGWAASIDDQATEIHRVDYALRGVCVPRGSHVVTLKYEPAELKIGLTISTIAIITIILAGVKVWRVREGS